VEFYLFLYDGQSLRIDNESFDLFQYVSYQDGHFIVISVHHHKQSIRMRHQLICQARKLCIISKFRERIVDYIGVESEASFKQENIRRNGTLTSLIQQHEPMHCNDWKRVNGGRMFTMGSLPSKVYTDASFRDPKSVIFLVPQSRQGRFANEVRTSERLV
jgi:hypothetical protein